MELEKPKENNFSFYIFRQPLSLLGKLQKSSFLNGRAIKALPPPPSGLMAIKLNLFYSHKIAGNEFLQFFFCPNFWTKYPYFLENIVTTQIKYPPTNLK